MGCRWNIIYEYEQLFRSLRSCWKRIDFVNMGLSNDLYTETKPNDPTGHSGLHRDQLYRRQWLK